jgi:hypothetical protein
MSSDEEIEEFSLHSLLHKMAMRAPPANTIPNDVEGQEFVFLLRPSVMNKRIVHRFD